MFLVTTDTDASVTSKRAAADYASTFDGDDTNLDEEVGVFFILIFKIYFFQTYDWNNQTCPDAPFILGYLETLLEGFRSVGLTIIFTWFFLMIFVKLS